MNQKNSVNSRISPWLISLVYPLARYLVIPGYFGRLEVEGQENIPACGPVIVAPTHRSRWDAIIVPLVTGRLVSGRDLHYMVMSTEMTGLQGWFIRRLGGFAVDVEHPEISSFRHSVDLLSQGKMLVIFPEGGIVRENQVCRIKPGVARIALKVETSQPGCAIKILPMSIKYNRFYPSWGTNVKVTIGQPINVADYLGSSVRQSYQKLTDDLYSTLSHLYEGKKLKKSQVLV